ncbi:MAG: RagB/SusD family nutrient uptake outer membrane protein [Bacteroidales bacterium]|nr:RagB/SusD family nutrient uptake outer membrane protein [Bacteroidales bacterium]MBR5432614.1 RagB/SusD family nutrient uptake outer membrane protein [Bacteroidales bacterium]
MKRLSIIASILLLSVSFNSCMSELDNPQQGTLDLDTYYANAGPAETQQLIAAAYNSYFGTMDVGTQNMLDIIGGDATNGGGTWADNANAYRDGQELILTVDSWPFNGSNEYQNLYKVIYMCNLILDKVTATGPEIDRYKAEAKFLRALALFEAIRWFGTPPFADHLYGEDDMLAENGNQAEMAEWILKNLEEASQVLPAVPGKGQQAQIGGRATKYAAIAYYGKIAVWCGTNLNDNALVQKGKTALKQVIDCGLYDLNPNIEDLFHVAADFCSEYIFERNAAETEQNKNRQADNRHTWRGLRVDRLYMPTGIPSTSWGYCLPSKNFVEFLIAHDGGEDNPRFRSKIMSYERLLSLPYDNDNKGVLEGNCLPDCVGYFNVPSMLWLSECYTGTGSSYYSRANLPLLRFADVLLLYAEACFVTKSDEASGLAALNRVRERAGLEALTSMTYQDIMDERRAEMWCERDWFFDLRRWKVADKYLKDAGKVRYEFWGYKPGTTEYDIREVKGPGNGWQDKYWLFPYNTNQLQANPNLQQNPGW